MLQKQLKYQLLNSDELSLCFGLTRQFEFDSRCLPSTFMELTGALAEEGPMK